MLTEKSVFNLSAENEKIELQQFWGTFIGCFDKWTLSRKSKISYS